ncbi:hypothetical protein [Afipia sp. GAS231]|uniref:hypothetical protein n=1 Tax=Afipia sp. GAS231 TaxID=1882747 RepID=UPI00087B6C19|nr:hypothetical protein [Afipia sp. GAS231]SDN75055.1 hypothetical protein SAMN05444050_2329 [Afipia sp. GAS231]
MPSIFLRTESQKAALRKLRDNPFVPVLGIGGLCVFSNNILVVFRTGQIEWANRFRPNVMISYFDHPWLFTFAVCLSVFGIPFCLSLIYFYVLAIFEE